MDLFVAIILGLVEGLTEYLPVSSTGHLLLAEQVMGLRRDGLREAADAYAVCIQFGAVAAVLVLYWPRFLALVAGLVGRDKQGRQLLGRLVLAFVPAAVIGLVAADTIKTQLFGLWPVVAAWFAGGLVLLGVGRFVAQRGTAAGDLYDVTPRHALLIGCAQCMALWPGVSRSLVTLLAGMWVGLNLPAAIEFSFLLGVITLGAAAAHDAIEVGPLMVQNLGATSVVAGFLAATLAAAVSVRWMVGYLSRHGLALFGWYRIIVAVVVALLLRLGVLAS